MTARQMKELDKVYTHTLVTLYRALDQCSEEQKLEILTRGMIMYLARTRRPHTPVTTEEIRSYVHSQMRRTA